MDEILKNAITQVPSLVVLAVVVFAFLKFISGQALFVRQLHDEHMTARRESRDALKEVSEVMRELSDAVRKSENGI